MYCAGYLIRIADPVSLIRLYMRLFNGMVPFCCGWFMNLFVNMVVAQRKQRIYELRFSRSG